MNNQEDFHFVFSKLNEQRQTDGKVWLQFLEKDTLRCGIYHLAAGATDSQQPHTEDEVYYVASGKGHFEVEGKAIEVGAGSILFVAAGDQHRFMDIEEDLSVLVFFAKAKS